MTDEHSIFQFDICKLNNVSNPNLKRRILSFKQSKTRLFKLPVLILIKNNFQSNLLQLTNSIINLFGLSIKGNLEFFNWSMVLQIKCLLHKKMENLLSKREKVNVHSIGNSSKPIMVSSEYATPCTLNFLSPTTV